MYSKSYSNVDKLIVIAIVATTFLPSTMVFHMFRMVLVGAIFFVKSRKINKIFLVWMYNIGLAAIAVLLVERSLLSSNILHEFVRVLFYILVVEVCLNTKIELRTLYQIAIVVLIIHFIIQMTQFLGMNVFDSMIVNHYLAGDSNNIHYIQAVSSDYAFRSGSIFINPNVYVCYPSLCTGVFLQYYKSKKSTFSLIMVVIAFFSIVLTGSRMGLGTFAMIIMLFIIKETKLNFKLTKGKIFVVLLVILVIANWGYVSVYLDEMRAFNLEEAYEGSLGTKLSGIKAYFTISNPLYYLTGSLGSPRCTFAIDMEYGYIFAWYGLIGVYWFVKLLKMLYTNKKSIHPIIAKSTLITILLTDIAASIILNMSVFPFVCVFALTKTREIGERYETH